MTILYTYTHNRVIFCSIYSTASILIQYACTSYESESIVSMICLTIKLLYYVILWWIYCFCFIHEHEFYNELLCSIWIFIKHILYDFGTSLLLYYSRLEMCVKFSREPQSYNVSSIKFLVCVNTRNNILSTHIF